MPERILLGPQEPRPTIAEAFDAGGISPGPVAAISAGWQESEGDLDDLRARLPRELIAVDLYARAEQLFAQDAVLAAAYRDRQEQLMELQRLYALRLRAALSAARQVRRSGASRSVALAEERHAIAQLRALDRHHLRRTRGIHRAFQALTSESALVREHAAAIERSLADCDSVLITGGHVIVLLNRLQLFGIERLLRDRHIVAWSAGAMALSERVVLFHDKTPLGRREPELIGEGLGLVAGFVFLPDARRRLDRQDAVRIGVFNRRFSPARCLALDSGSLLHLRDGELRDARHVSYLTAAGTLAEYSG